MFANAQIIFWQLLRMFLYIIIGFILYRAKLVDKKGTGSISNLLIYICLPCVIFNSLNVERSPENIRIVLYSLLAGLIATVLTVVISLVLYRKKPIDCFSAAFSNSAFLGIPLITSVLGSGAAIYITGFLLIQGFAQWAFYAIFLHPPGEKPNLRALFTGPITIAVLLGFLLFFTGLRLPGLVGETVEHLAACNSPVATILLGTYVGKTKLSQIFTSPRLYGVSAVRLLVIPLLTALALCVIPASLTDLRTAMLISAGGPVAVVTAAYSQKAGLDYTYAARIICLTTILSLVTLPLTVIFAGLIW